MSVTSLNSDRWCILRTSGGRTLSLATSLSAAGIPAWTPSRTTKRIKPGRRNLIDGKPATVEVSAPILPTFVFADAVRLGELAALTLGSAHPAFSIMREANRYPLVADRQIAGLRRAEDEAAAALAQAREAESREERRRLRAAAATTERERLRALRAKLRHIPAGTAVSVVDVHAFAGMSGIVRSSDGRSAVVCFGGQLTMKIEAWQLVESAVQTANEAAI